MFGRKVTDPKPVFSDWRPELWYDPYVDKTVHKFSTVTDDLHSEGRNYKPHLQTLSYSTNRIHMHGEVNDIPNLYTDSKLSESATDSQAEEDTQIHYLNEHIPANVRDSRTHYYSSNPGALFAPYYKAVPEFQTDHLVESSQNIFNPNSSLSPLKTVAQEELANSVPEISTDGLEKYCKLVEQQRKDREVRINNLGLQLKHSRSHHYDDEPLVPNVLEEPHISHFESEKPLRTRLVTSAPPFNQYKGFSVLGTNSPAYKVNAKSSKSSENVINKDVIGQKNIEIKLLPKSKKCVTRILASNGNGKPRKENTSGLITTWAWHQCQEANFRELSDLKNASSSHSPPTHDTDYQQTISAPDKEEPDTKPSSVAINDIKAVLDSSKKSLSEEARTILNDLQLTKLDNLSDEENKEADSKHAFEVNSVPSVPHFTKILSKSSHKRKATKTDADNLNSSLPKHRHYNPEAVRKYIAQQQSDRKRRQYEEQEAAKLALEQRRQRLQDLFKKQKETVISNKQVRTVHSNKKNYVPNESISFFSTDSNNKAAAAVQQLKLSSKLLDQPSTQENIEEVLESDLYALSQSEREDEDNDEQLTNERGSEADSNGMWASPNHPFVTVRSSSSKNHSNSRHRNSGYSASYCHSPILNVTSNPSYPLHLGGINSNHSLPQSINIFNNGKMGSSTTVPGLNHTPVPSGIFNSYLPTSKYRAEKIKAIKEVADDLQGRIAAQTQLLTQGIHPSMGPQPFQQQQNIALSDMFDSNHFAEKSFDRITHKNQNVQSFNDATIPSVKHLSEHVEHLERQHLHHKAAMKIQAAYRNYQTRHNLERPEENCLHKSQKRNIGHNTSCIDEHLISSSVNTRLSTGPLPNDDSDLLAYSKKMARLSTLSRENWKFNSEVKPSLENRNMPPLLISEPDQHSVINIFMQRLKEDKHDIVDDVRKPVLTESPLHYISSSHSRSNSSSSTEDGQSTSNSNTNMSKTTTSPSTTSLHEARRQSRDISSTSVDKSEVSPSYSSVKTSLNEKFLKGFSTGNSSQNLKMKSTSILKSCKENDKVVDKDFSPPKKTLEDSSLKTVSPDNTLNMSSSFIDDEACTIDNSLSKGVNSSSHFKTDASQKYESVKETIFQAEIDQCSPATLQMKLAAELAHLETVEESLKQLDNIEKARALAMAQQETVSLTHILKARQQSHKQEIENLSKQMKEGNHTQLEDIRKLTVHSNADNVSNLNQEAAALSQDSSLKLITEEIETVTSTEDEAKSSTEIGNLSSPHFSTLETSNAGKPTVEASKTSLTVTLDEQRKQQIEFFKHLRKTKNGSILSYKLEQKSNSGEDYVHSETRSSKSSILSRRKTDYQDSSSSTVISHESAKASRSHEQSPITKSKSISEIIHEDNGNGSAKYEEFIEKEINGQSRHMVFPSDNLYQSNKTEKSHSEATLSDPNFTGSDKWKSDDGRLFSGEDSFKKYTAEMIKQYMDDEEVRAQHHEALLRLRERALKEKTKAEMTWLELQKQRLRDKGADDLMPPLRKKQRGLLLRFQQERAEIKRLKEAQKVASQKRQLLLYQQQEIARIQQSTQHILEKIKKSGIFYSQPSIVPTEDEVSMPVYDASQSDIQDEAASAFPTDIENSLTENPSETPSVSQDTHLSPSDTESKVLKKLKKLETQSNTRYLTKREQKLRQRREQVEALLAWGENLDKEEAEITKMERKAFKLLGRQEKAIQAPDSGSTKKNEDENKIQDEEAIYLTSKEISPLKSDTQKELPYEKNQKSTSSESSISEEIEKHIISHSKEKSDSRQDEKKTTTVISSDNSSNTLNSGLLEQLSEDSPKIIRKNEVTSPPSLIATAVHSKSESIKEDILPAIISSPKSSDYTSFGELTSSSKKSLSLHSKGSVTEDISSTKQLIHSRDPSMSLRAPLSPRPTQKYRESSGSEESISVSHSETASDQSDMEGRIRALKEELKRRKVEAARLKREQKRRNYERLRAQEASLLIQIEAYDKFIIQAKEELNKELELDVKAPGLKPQIKQPRRLQRQDSSETTSFKVPTVHPDEVNDNDDVFKATSPGWMSDQLSLLKRVSLESIDESIESSESPEITPKSLAKSVSENNSETDEDIKEEVAAFFSVDHSDGSESVKCNSTVKNQTISPICSIVEENSHIIEKNAFFEPVEEKQLILENEIDFSEKVSSKIDTANESLIPEETENENDNSILNTTLRASAITESKSSFKTETAYSEDFCETSSVLQSHVQVNTTVSSKSSSTEEKLSSKSDEHCPETDSVKSQYIIDSTSQHSSKSLSEFEEFKKPQIGDKVIIKNSKMGVLKFIGKTLFSDGIWAGVLLDKPEGTCDGSVDGVEYFHCDFNCGIFVPLNTVSFLPISSENQKEESKHLDSEDSPSKDSEDTLVEEKQEADIFEKELTEANEAILEQVSNSSKDESVCYDDNFCHEKIEVNKIAEVEEKITAISTFDSDLEEVISSTAFAVEQFANTTIPWLVSDEKEVISDKEIIGVDKKRELDLNGLVDKISNSLTNMIIQDSLSVIGSIAKYQDMFKKSHKCIPSDVSEKKTKSDNSATAYEIHIEEEMIIEISDNEVSKLSHDSLVIEMTQTLTENLLNDAITCIMNIGEEKLKALKLSDGYKNDKECNNSETTLDKVHNLLARHSEKKKEQSWSKTADIFALSPQDAYADALESPEFPSPVHVSTEKRTSPTFEVDDTMKGRQGSDSREGSASPTSPVPRPSSPIFGEPAVLNQSELQEKLAVLHFLDMDIMEGSVFGEHSLFGDQEWFDDDFGLGHQREVHRQIPQKPAPPYTPPAVQWNLSRLELKKITAKAFCAVAHNEKDVQELVNKAVKEFYNRRKYGEPLIDVPPPINYFTREDRNEDIESRSRRTYKHFLFELTGYLVQEVYRDDEAPERPPWMKPSRNQHYKFCKKYPANEQELQKVILNSINHLLGFVSKSKQEWPYVKWNRKKKDRVDEILVQELREEEQSWVIYDDEELSVKMQLTDGILDSLILDTVRTFSTLFEKKKAKLHRS